MIFFQKVLPVQKPLVINRGVNRLSFNTLAANYINRDIQKTQIKQTPSIKPHQLIEKLAPGWHSLSPFLNALTKCFKYGENNSNCLWILAWIKDDAISFENKPYKPLSFYPEELNKAMESISKNKREKVLKRIAQEIINTPSIDLLKLTA